MKHIICPACGHPIPAHDDAKVAPTHGMGHRWGVCPGSGSRPVEATTTPTSPGNPGGRP